MKSPVTRKTTPRKRVKTQSQLRKTLDTIFSRYVRQKDIGKYGLVPCYTCGIIKHWKELHCGHFMSRIYLNTRYDERNTRPQCVGCNIYGNGKPAEFGSNLELETPGIVAILMKEARIIRPNFPYQQLIEEYTEKLKNVVELP